LGTDEYTEVNDSIAIIGDVMKINPKLEYTGGERGWIGDIPFIYLDTKKIRSTGWKPEKTIRESVKITTEYLLENPWVWDSSK
jgi:UDP-glucose 4-epimerase